MNFRPLERKAILEVKTFIDQHFKEKLSVQSLSKMDWQNGQVKFRSRRLHEAFTESYLQSIHAYLISLKIEKAKSLLRTTDLSVKAVAISVGYRSDNAFTTVFRKFVGVTPTAYRNADGE